MGIEIGIGTILAGIAAAGTAASVVQGQKSASAQRKAARTQQQQQELADRRTRRQAIRQARIARAAAANTGVQVGGGDPGSSGLAGGLGGISSQLGSSLGFSNQMSGLSDIVSMYGNKAVKANNRSQLFGSAASLAFTGSQLSGLPNITIPGLNGSNIPNYNVNAQAQRGV